MSKHANPTVIGGFAIGAALLITLAVMLFGGGALFKSKNTFVTYLDGSVKGLRVGSAVLFRGVQIGHVSEIQLIAEVDTFEFRTAVYLDIFDDSLTLVRDGVRIHGDGSSIFMSIEKLIEAGLRAQLNTASFVTGQLVVQLDLEPDRPAVFRGVKVRNPEIPSIPSDIQRVMESVRRFIAEVDDALDVDQLAEQVDSILRGVDELVNSRELRNAIAGVDSMINAEATQELTASLQRTLSELDETLVSTRKLVDTADAELGPALEGVGPAIEELRATLVDGRSLLVAAETQIGESSRLSYRLNRSLVEIEGAARSVRILLEYLEQHPEALLKGKGR